MSASMSIPTHEHKDVPLLHVSQRVWSWKRTFIVLSPFALSTCQALLPIYMRYLLAPYTPRAVIHTASHPLSSLLLGPITLTPTLPAFISRLAQAGVLAVLPLDTAGWAWAFWVVLASARVLTGYILTRSVGWAAPRWFSHEALYEAAGGYGPGLLAVLAIRGLEGATLPAWVPDTGRTRALWAFWGLGVLTGIFCWLEWAPWTYGHACLGIVLLKGLLAARSAYMRWLGATEGIGLKDGEEWEVQVLHFTDQAMDGDRMESGEVSDTVPSMYDISGSRIARHRPWADSLVAVASSLAAILLPCLLCSWLFPGYPPNNIHLPSEPEGASALMDILVLSYPRPPSAEISAQVLNDTIASYLPFLSDDITLSVFTHASDHPGFERVRDAYTSSDQGEEVNEGDAANGHLTFFQDTDAHPDDASGHYLHLAEAFRWANEQKRGEWIMLVEDDFPVCWGALGWGYVQTVLGKLERERAGEGTVRYGWVGTGGSGLIMHHTLLSMLSYLLHTYSTSPPLAPSTIVIPAPDELIQACLMGRHSACLPSSGNPHYHPSVMAASELKAGYYGEAEPHMIITSRLVLDHIGGMATTTAGKAGNSDKWRCGWRHPYHGADEVQVVVVHY